MDTSIAQQRLYNQHITRPDFGTPAQAVSWFGAVQAQDYLSALYAIGVRMRLAVEQEIEKAIADRTIVRSWPMRNTTHFMAAEDARWMIRLLASRQNARMAKLLSQAELTDHVFLKAEKVVTRTLQGGKRLPRQDIYRALNTAGINTDGENRGLFILQYLAKKGVICGGPRLEKQHTFVLLDEWLPPGLTLEGEGALAELARRYFTSHGPATVQDFAWWSGLTLVDASRALESVSSQFVFEKMDKRILWRSGDASGVKQANEGASIHLLPSYDEYTVAYKDRRLILGAGMPSDPFLILGPVILRNGLIIGNWKRTLKKDVVEIECTLYSPLGLEDKAALEKAFERYGAFIGLPPAVEYRAQYTHHLE